jgi:hypothetical protein
MINLGAKIKGWYNRFKLRKDEVSNEMTYVMFCNALKKPNVAETLQEYGRTHDFGNITALLNQKETLFDLCRIVRIMYCHDEKSFEDFFVELKKVVNALELQYKIKQ